MDQKIKTAKSWLALGDSYTIGEQVPLHESFPYQTLQLLRQTAAGAESRRQGSHTTPAAAPGPAGGWQYNAPEIIAKTGWTTDELNDHINQCTFSDSYDIVTLLIGVNNQYRGRNWYEFKIEFTHLLQRAIAFAGGNNKNVFVLSIPDWGVTPFAKDRDIDRIALEIDKYNEMCKSVSEEYHCHYIDITASQRADGANAEFLAADGLHPSGKEYARWAQKLTEAIQLAEKNS